MQSRFYWWFLKEIAEDNLLPLLLIWTSVTLRLQCLTLVGLTHRPGRHWGLMKTAHITWRIFLKYQHPKVTEIPPDQAFISQRAFLELQFCRALHCVVFSELRTGCAAPECRIPLGESWVGIVMGSGTDYMYMSSTFRNYLQALRNIKWYHSWELYLTFHLALIST